MDFVFKQLSFILFDLRQQVYSIFSFKHGAVVPVQNCLLTSTELCICVCIKNLLGEMFKMKKYKHVYLVSHQNKQKFDLFNSLKK